MTCFRSHSWEGVTPDLNEGRPVSEPTPDQHTLLPSLLEGKVNINRINKASNLAVPNLLWHQRPVLL